MSDAIEKNGPRPRMLTGADLARMFDDPNLVWIREHPDDTWRRIAGAAAALAVKGDELGLPDTTINGHSLAD
jgi:hypothetical protein